MKNPSCVAANLSANERKGLVFLELTQIAQVTQLAEQQGVSRQFIDRQKHMAELAIDQAFAPDKAEALFHLSVTPAWLDELMLSLTLICKSSCRGVQEFMRDLLDVSISGGTVHSRLQGAGIQAAAINRAQNLSAIGGGLRDEIFQGSMLVLGVDADSTNCYLLAAAEQRDSDTWAIYLLDACKQGFNPQDTIAGAGQGLRAGQKVALSGTPCHGDVFHIQQQCESLANVLARLAKGAISSRKVLEQEMVEAKEIGCGNTAVELII